MNIAFFGSSLVSAYWNGAATYYRGIIRALHLLGHRITFYEPDAYQRQQHRDIEDPYWARVVVYSNEADLIGALNESRHADMLVKTSGVGVFDELLERAIIEYRRPNALAVFWDVDAPATLERINSDPADHMRELIPEYDLILTYGGGYPVVQGYQKLGACECVPIYNALDPQTHFPVCIDGRFESDLSLLANRLPDRERRIQEFFLKVALQLSDKEFVLGGNGWSTAALNRNITYVGHVYTRDHNAFNSSSRAVLNVNRDSMARFGFSPPTRVFEAAGAGACLITDAWEGIEMFLEPGKEVLVASDGEEVAEHVRSLTADRARAIGSTARQRVLAEHTYTHRAIQLHKLLGGNGSVPLPISSTLKIRSANVPVVP